MFGNGLSKQEVNTYRLREFPSCPYMNDIMYKIITIIVDEGERPCLIGDCQCKLVIIYQANLSNIYIHLTSHNPELQQPNLSKHCRKRRKCWKPAFSPFPTMFSIQSKTNYFQIVIDLQVLSIGTSAHLCCW